MGAWLSASIYEGQEPAALHAGLLGEQLVAAVGMKPAIAWGGAISGRVRVMFPAELSPEQMAAAEGVVAQHDGSARLMADEEAIGAKRTRRAERRARLAALRDKRRAGHPYTPAERDELLDLILQHLV